MSPTRREVLSAGAAATAGALAGCLGSLGAGGTDADGYASFFALRDWADAVGGDVLEFETPVETGEMGHGWTPDGDIVPRIVATDLFVYLDTPEFQWAVDAATTLERDYEDEVVVVDALAGLGPQLLPFDGGGDPPEPVADREFTREELAIGEFELWDRRTGQQEGWWHSGRDHWHGGPPDVAVGDEVALSVVIPHVEDETIAAPLGENERFHVEVRLADGADEGVLDIDSRGDHVLLEGIATGETDLVFEIYDGDELVEDTSGDPARVTVVETYSEDAMPGSFDPHAWVDPVLAGEMVDTIADALAEYDPENADTYRANAEDYRAELAAVDEQLEQLVADATLDIAVFAGHDSFQYLEQRYGFDLVTPTGVSPNEAVASSDIADLVEIIETNSIDTLLYDPFEAARPGEDYPQIVDALLEDSSATAAEPLSHVSGLTQTWAENDWGYVEQMEQVNAPSLSAALNPSG
jgi:zinc transport system substrate-binding protein